VWSHKGGGAEGAMAIAIPLAAAWAAMYLVGLTLTEMQGRHRLMPALFVAALVVIGWSDVAWARGDTPLWAVGWAIALLATRTYRGTSGRRQVISTGWSLAFVPYVLVAPAAVAFATQWGSVGNAGPQVSAGALMVILLLVRQHVTWWENRRLVHRLARTECLLRHQATHDHLTGLAGRVLLVERLEEAARGMQHEPFEVALVFIDLDGFKAVNDAHGHAGGDHLLVEVARRLSHILEPMGSNALAVRISGDEFAVLLVREEALESIHTARVILDEITHPVDVNGSEVRVGASVGVASIMSDALDPSALLGAADRAMYRIKHGGKGGIARADGEPSPAQGT